MWESRVLGEISKVLWKSFCDVHRTAISTALFMVSLATVERSTQGVLHPSPAADRRASGILGGRFLDPTESGPAWRAGGARPP